MLNKYNVQQKLYQMYSFINVCIGHQGILYIQDFKKVNSHLTSSTMKSFIWSPLTSIVLHTTFLPSKCRSMRIVQLCVKSPTTLIAASGTTSFPLYHSIFGAGFESAVAHLNVTVSCETRGDLLMVRSIELGPTEKKHCKVQVDYL